MLVGFCFACFTASPLHAQRKPPFEVVRSLEALQDQIAIGNKAALAALPELSGQLAEKLLAADPAVWREQRNVRAAITYVLSGGQPRVLRKILASGECPASEKTLMEGTLAYAEGHEAKAKQILANIDPRTLEAIAGGHVALAQASLIARDNPRKAIELLDTARILAPGTLVEEAALRREVFLSEQIDDFDKFNSSASQYLRRFANSSYAGNFENRFSTSLVTIGMAGKIDQIRRLEGLLNEMGNPAQLRLYLAIAQAALVSGKLETAKYAATKSMQLAPQGTSEASRAALYNATADVLMQPLDDGVGRLESLDLAKLTRRDSDLAEAAIALGKDIHRWPEASKPARGQDVSKVPVPSGFTETMASSESAIDIAQKGLVETDNLLKEKRP